MVIVAGHWEIGYNVPLIESNHWDFPLRDFGVSEWRMVPITGIKNYQHTKVNLTEYKDYHDMLDSAQDLTRVFLEPRTQHQNPDTEWLHEFDHPEDCIYVFGSAHFNPTLAFKREGDKVVTIKTLEDRGLLWADQCIAITLYDRTIKQLT